MRSAPVSSRGGSPPDPHPFTRPPSGPVARKSCRAFLLMQGAACFAAVEAEEAREGGEPAGESDRGSSRLCSP